MANPKDILEFIDQTETNAKGITIERSESDVLRLAEEPGNKKIEKMRVQVKNEFQEKYGVAFSAQDIQLTFLTSTVLEWTRPEVENEGLIKGGFVFNELEQCFTGESFEFWARSSEQFEKMENRRMSDMQTARELVWIESPLLPFEAEYAPQFGCVKPSHDKLPTEFFYFDSGLLFPMQVNTYYEYLDALIKSASVRFWQYLFVDPDVVISASKGINYQTWSGYKFARVEGKLVYEQSDQDLKADRLDLVIEYLGNCINVLPETFPFLKFSEISDKYGLLKAAYINSKHT